MDKDNNIVYTNKQNYMSSYSATLVLYHFYTLFFGVR